MVSVKQVQTALGVTRPLVDAWIKSGELPAVNVGAGNRLVWRVRQSDLDAFLARRFSRSVQMRGRMAQEVEA